MAIDDQTNIEDAEYTDVGREPASTSKSITKYDQFSRQRTQDKATVQNLERGIAIAIKEANKDAYNRKSGLALIVKGVSKRNFGLVKNGAKKALGMNLSLSEILKASYTDLVNDTNSLGKNIDEAQGKLAQLYSEQSQNINDRESLYTEALQFESKVKTLGASIEILKEKKSSMKSSEPNYENSVLQLEKQIQDLDKEKAEQNILFRQKMASFGIKKETADLINVYIQERIESIPHIVELHEVAKERVKQADLVIETSIDSIYTVEKVLSVVASYEGIRGTLKHTNDVLIKFNQNMTKLTGYVSTTPLLDEKDMAQRISSIRTLQEDASYKQLREAKLNDFEHMSYSDCYEFLNLNIAADQKTADKARDSMFNHVPEENKDLYTRQVDYAHNVVTKMIQMGASGASRQLR